MSQQVSTIQMLDRLLEVKGELPDWESNFISSINSQVQRIHNGDITKLSHKQIWRLGMIYNQHGG